MDCNIIGFDVYIPNVKKHYSEISSETGIAKEVIIDKFGINQKIMPDTRDSAESMGILAAKKVINKCGISANEIDVVIWVGSVNHDKMMYVTAIKIAKEIQAMNSWAFDMNAMCSSMIAGIEISKSLINTGCYKKILLVSGCRDHDFLNQDNKDTHFLLNLSAGGSALLIGNKEQPTLGKIEPLNQDNFKILSSKIICDPKLAGLCFARKNTAMKHSYELIVEDVDYFKSRLNEVSANNFSNVIREAIDKSGITIKDIDYVAILHMKKSAHLKIINDMGLDESKSIYLSDYGHMQQNDQLLSLKLAIENKQIKKNSKILLVGAGLGFTWGATVIVWEENSESFIHSK